MEPEALALSYATLNFVATLLIVILSLFISWKQGISSTLTFSLLLWAGALHTLVNGLIVVSGSEELAGILENFRWLFLAVIPPLLLIFILNFTGRGQRISTKWLLILFAIPVTTQFIVWTNGQHNLMIQAGYDQFNQIGPYLLPGERVFGPWFWVHAIWGYFLTLISLYILVQDTFTKPQLEWQQFLWLFVGFFIPIWFSIVDTFKLIEPTWFKLLPIGLVIMGIFFFIAITRDQFINIIPVARGYLIETLHDPVFMVDRDHCIADINFAGCQLLGKSRDALIGRPAKDVLAYWPNIARLFQSSDDISTAVKVVRDVNDQIHESQITPLRARGKVIFGWLIIFHDITQLKDAETRASQLATVIEQAHETVMITDLNANITYANPFFETATGYSLSEVIGKNPNILQSGVQNKDFYNNLWQEISSGNAWADTFINKRKDGTLFHEAATIFPIKDSEGTTTSYAAVKRDITKQVETEKSLQEYARQQTLLNEITKVAIQQKDFDEMVQTMADRMGQLFKADGSYITLWVEENHLTLPKAAHGVKEKTYSNLIISDPETPTFTKLVLNTGDYLIVPDIYKSQFVDQRLTANFPEQSALVLPLIANDQKLGASIITFNTDHGFTDSEIERALQAGQQIALAIFKAFLFDETERRAKEAETLRFASAAIAVTLELDQAVEKILEELNRVVPYDSASVQLLKGSEMEIIGVRGFSNKENILGLRLPINQATPNQVVFDTHKPYILEDAPDKYAAFLSYPYNHVRGWMGIPLIVHENLIGMLTLDSKVPNRFNENHARLASAFASQVAIALENARLFEETRRLSITDSLTNLYNRRHFMELARREFDRCNRYKTPLSIIMLDLDHFKKINDTYGHLVGDHVLQTAAKICRKNLRSLDIIGRFGGEEYIILLPETPVRRPSGDTKETDELDPLPAQIVAERLRKTFAEHEHEINGHTISLTISLGIADLTESDHNIENIIDRADQALLLAKNQGRDRVIIASAEGKLAENTN